MIRRMLNKNQNMTQSESEEEAVNLDDKEDEMTFLRTVTTRSERMVKVTSKFF